MIWLIITVLTAFIVSGAFWYVVFYKREKRLLSKLQEMIDTAKGGELNRTEISKEKYSALENSLKQYLDESLLAGENRQKQKDMIQSLISDIAHQTLTPVSNLKLYGQILSEGSEENREAVDTILEQTEKLEFLIESLVKLSRLESGIISVCPKMIKISDLMKQVKNQYIEKSKEKNIDITISDTDFEAMYDLKWTAEAVGNIVDNAIKYTPQGGRVDITVQEYSFFVRIDIKDTGIGIDEEEIPKIFTRFYRSFSVADQEGVGIGLYLAREIIRVQKGYIKVISKPGEGSVFSVFLPR